MSVLHKTRWQFYDPLSAQKVFFSKTFMWLTYVCHSNLYIFICSKMLEQKWIF
jgi:hypothetical protein